VVPALAKILLYLVLVVLTGAVLAPPIYWLLHPALDFPFYRYLSRVTQIAAFVLLGPLLYWLGIRRTKEFGLEQNPRGAKDFVAGLVLALMPGIALGAAYLVLDVYRIRDEVLPLAIVPDRRDCGGCRDDRGISLSWCPARSCGEGLRFRAGGGRRFRDFCGGSFSQAAPNGR
jgi:hypothetical protein